MPNDNKNLITFVAMAILLLVTYETYTWFVVDPAARAAAARAHAEAPAAGPAAPAAAPAQPRLSRVAALALSPRVIVDTPSLAGSIALKGARFDDLLEIFVRVERIGTTSITYDHAAYRVDDDGDTLMVTAKATVVCIALDERKAVPVPDAFRAQIATLEDQP